MAIIGEWDFVLYRGSALSQGLTCTKIVHLGGLHRGVSTRQGWPGWPSQRGVNTSGVTRGSTVSHACTHLMNLVIKYTRDGRTAVCIIMLGRGV